MTKFTRRAAVLGACVCIALSAADSIQAADAWPAGKQVRIIVPFPPGGSTDQVGRRLQAGLQKELGVSVIIDNRGGASGSVGTQIAARSAPDGSTFLLVFDTHGVNPSIIPNLPYDTLKDFAPIMLIGKSPMVITTHAGTSYKTFAEVVAAAKAKPGSLSYGTIGAGSLGHLAMTYIDNELKSPMTHVPYNGGGPLSIDALAGHIPLEIGSVALLSPHIQTGKLRPLAVTSAKRYAPMPDVPTVTEQGVAGFEAESWWGLLAPAKTPPEIIARMHTALKTALEDPAVKQSLSEQGVIYELSSPAAFGTFLESEINRWSKVVKDNKITAGG